MRSNGAVADTRELPRDLRDERLQDLFSQLGELCGQRNAIDGQIVEIVAEIDRDGLWADTGCRSVAGLVAWKTGTSRGNAETIAAVAHRAQEFPRCTAGLRHGQLSLDQVGVIAQRAGAGDGADEHADQRYEQLARCATVNQLRTAIKLEPREKPDPPDPRALVTRTRGDIFDTWRLRLSRIESEEFDAALHSHLEALVAEYKHQRGGREREPDEVCGQGHDDRRPPFPTKLDAFTRLVEHSWDAEATVRPHGQRTSVVVHVDAATQVAALHLGPLLSDAERQYLTCDATAQVWFQRDGKVFGAGRSTRTVNRRLRRALEHRYPTCAIPGCGATYGLHAHHLWHWEHGGPTELWNLVLICPHHHRSHHKGAITLTGPAECLVVTDSEGRQLHPGPLARPPVGRPPDVPGYRGPSGERANWWWYQAAGQGAGVSHAAQVKCRT